MKSFLESDFMFTHAIVRRPCPEMIRGLTTASLGKPDFNKALEQHDHYIKALQTCGLEVTALESDSRFPDSTFVEDVALCTSKCAVITNPGAPSRNGEQVEMESVLRSFFDQVEAIKTPGTLDAGDVMMVGTHYYVGLSERTNQAGAEQLIGILGKFQMTGSMVPMKKMLHLKSGLSYLEKNNLLISGEFATHPAFHDFNKIFIEPHEVYAANSLWVNSTVLVPAGFTSTKEKIERAGYKTISVDVSEFQKLDGGLSCLSLRF